MDVDIAFPSCERRPLLRREVANTRWSGLWCFRRRPGAGQYGCWPRRNAPDGSVDGGIVGWTFSLPADGNRLHFSVAWPLDHTYRRVNNVPSICFSNSVGFMKIIQGVGLRRQREKWCNYILIYQKWKKKYRISLLDCKNTTKQLPIRDYLKLHWLGCFGRLIHNGTTFGTIWVFFFFFYLLVPWELMKLGCTHVKECRVSFSGHAERRAAAWEEAQLDC